VAARLSAVGEALAAFEAGEDGAGWAYRQALVECAAVCERLAADLPAPRERSERGQAMAAAAGLAA
jgi:hypothetical protein